MVCPQEGPLRRLVSALLLCMLASPLAAQTAPAATGDLLGYTKADGTVERDWETKFRAIPEAKRAHENMRFLAAHPHNVGSDAQRKNAEWMVAKYKEWGWDAHIEQFDVLYPTPKTMLLEMTAPTKFKA